MDLLFSKYSGCGNDFILINNYSSLLPDSFFSTLALKLCHRHLGIGADGLILLENSFNPSTAISRFNLETAVQDDKVMQDFELESFPVGGDHSQKVKVPPNGSGYDSKDCVNLSSSTAVSRFNADFRMRIFNKDGSEAEMCGNGIRCLARFIKDLNLVDSNKNHFNIQTMHSTISVQVKDEMVAVQMPEPTNVGYYLTLDIQGNAITMHHLNTGVPHTIIFVNELKDELLQFLAPKIRHHPHFLSAGTNVNFARINSKGIVDLRTYERGVEQETLACGTGAVATAVASAKIHGLQSPIAICTRSNEILTISFNLEPTIQGSKVMQNLFMEGPAVKVFDGKIELQTF